MALASVDNEEQKLLEKLRLIEALFAGTTYAGERAAAAEAMQRIRERLRNTEQSDPPIPFKFTISDPWARKLFLALLRRYNAQPYRNHGQRRTTVMVRLPARFVNETLWPEFQQLSDTLRTYLDDVTERVISECIFADTSDASETTTPELVKAGAK